ncbi:O-antigen polymerase [Vibrio cholerae]|uniref:O-antigen polymerase n=1 Tax=Vibrio cholerae TaxID=666 RepID=UPI00031526BE|nr:O-antigen polymerase [Vibrio cholerae]ELQ6314214.1 oligosaccharide repeat unit polymerase [Vibrio cholerae]KNH56320.1 hypothetical protein A55_4144 [Vibrio cholerae 1587]WOQ96709.1 O-antigen polymerase [Vibrio cholerae]
MVISKSNLIFMLLIFSFFFDALINRFLSVPIYLVSIFIIALVLNLIGGYRIILTTVSLFVISFLSLIKRGEIEDFGYFVYFCFFSSSVLYLIYEMKHNRIDINKNISLILFFMISVFFWIYIFGVDNTVHDADFSVGGANLEYYRSYHSGLFRAPHFPSYLFYFTMIYFLCLYKEYSRLVIVLVMISCCLGILLSGSRTPVYAFIIASLFYFSLNKIRYSVLFLMSVLLFLQVYFNIEFILDFFENTPIYQYLTFIYTLKNEPERLSRIQLILVFINGVKDFNIIELFFGKSFGMQMELINESIGQRLWFHNDFLAVFYSYGLFGIMLFVWLLYCLYRYSVRGTRNFYIHVYFYSIVIFAFFNGLLYHGTYIFIIFLLWMKLHERKSFDIVS